MRVNNHESRSYREAVDNYKQANTLTTYSLRNALVWALERGLLETPSDVVLEYHLPRASEALRSEQVTVGSGPSECRARRRHSVEESETDPETGRVTQRTFWGHIEDAPANFLRRSIRQRLDKVATDYRSIEADVTAISSRRPDLATTLTQMLMHFRIPAEGCAEAG
jgi:hypothetical protein